VLKRVLAACALFMCIIGLTAVAPHAALSAATTVSANANGNAITLAPVKAQRHHAQEPAFIINHGRVTMLPSAAKKDINNWGGYAVDACSTCHLRYVNANFTVPKVSCANSTMGSEGAEDDFWVGLDGDTDNTVEQVGVQVVCASKTSAPAYSPWYEMYPLNPVTISRTVKAGDKIAISTYYDQSNNVYDMTFTDSSEGQSTYTKNGLTCPSGSSCLNKSAEVITENAGDGAPYLDLANFGAVTFSGTTVTSLDGTKGDLCAGPLWSMDENIMEDNSGNVMVFPTSPLSTCSGPDGFTDDFYASS
jgi:hypothetical protein